MTSRAISLLEYLCWRRVRRRSARAEEILRKYPHASYPNTKAWIEFITTQLRRIKENLYLQRSLTLLSMRPWPEIKGLMTRCFQAYLLFRSHCDWQCHAFGFWQWQSPFVFHLLKARFGVDQVNWLRVRDCTVQYTWLTARARFLLQRRDLLLVSPWSPHIRLPVTCPSRRCKKNGTPMKNFYFKNLFGNNNALIKI